jgi:hypothetical protein
MGADTKKKLSESKSIAVRRVNANLPEKVGEELDEIAEARGTTATQALSRAISTEHYLTKAIKAGAKILIRNPDGSVQELVFR